MPRRFLPLAALAGLGLSACSGADAPLAPRPGAAPPLSSVAIACRADVRAGSVACASPQPGARGDLIVGGQRTYVTVTSSNVHFDAQTGDFTFDATIQNLIPQPMATEDGTTPSYEGVRIFFSTPPAATSVQDPAGSSGIAVVPDDYAIFTASDQPYYAYSGYFLGDDGILSPNEVSLPKTWTLKVDPNVSTFTFTLYVWARVPSPGGWVDVTPGALTMAVGDTATLAGVIRNAVGTRIDGHAVGWASSNPGVATVDAGGKVTALAPGLATITGRDDHRVGTAEILVAGASNRTYASVTAGGALCALTTGKVAYCIGSGIFGELGSGTFVDQAVKPLRVLNAPWDTIVSADTHTCALKAGAAYCWGLDKWGTLGTGAMLPRCSTSPYGSSDYGCSNEPLPVAGGVAFTRITAAGNEIRSPLGPPYAGFSCALTAGQKTYCWGGDGDGELGDGTQYPLNNPAPQPVATNVAFVDVASGFDNSCGLTAQGAAYCWGNEEYGELGDDDVTSEVATTPQPVQGGHVFRQIDTGRYDSCAVDDAGDVWCWGQGYYGVLGTTAPLQSCTYGVACSPVPLKVEAPAGVKFTRVTVGWLGACAIDTTGAGWCWGHTSTVGAGSPEDIPGASYCYIAVYSKTCVRTPVRVATTFRFVDIDASPAGACAVTTSRQWVCWPFRPAFDTQSNPFVPHVMPDPDS